MTHSNLEPSDYEKNNTNTNTNQKKINILIYSNKIKNNLEKRKIETELTQLIKYFTKDEITFISSKALNEIYEITKQLCIAYGYEFYDKNYTIPELNKQIIDESDIIIVFWNGESENINKIIDYAQELIKKGEKKILLSIVFVPLQLIKNN